MDFTMILSGTLQQSMAFKIFKMHYNILVKELIF